MVHHLPVAVACPVCVLGFACVGGGGGVCLLGVLVDSAIVLILHP
jgi:hypothetical protein